MALRVLLADNSETIKKVIQLTLQDFALDLRVVTLGVDVLDVALQFKPDIIFVDILLQKKSGYEVSKELKNNVQLKNTPVVLMWSGFMEFDEPKAKESLADARLEKPFDADTLKGLVTKLVKKQEAPAVESFLDFPTPKAAAPTAAPKTQKHEDPLKALDKIKNESEKFKPIELPDLDAELESDNFTKATNEDDFEMQPLDKTSGFGMRQNGLEKKVKEETVSQVTKSFILNLPDDTSEADMPMEIEKIDSVEDMSFLLNPESVSGITTPNIPKAEPKPDLKPRIPSAPPTVAPKAAAEPTVTAAATPKAAAPAPAAKAPKSADVPLPTLEDIERIVREEVREAIEKAVWQVVPEMASQIIKKELDRLLGDEKDSKTKT